MQNALRIATATEVQNNFGKYLQYAVENGEVVILRNGKRVARLISEDAAIGYLTDSLGRDVIDAIRDSNAISADQAARMQKPLNESQNRVVIKRQVIRRKAKSRKQLELGTKPPSEDMDAAREEERRNLQAKQEELEDSPQEVDETRAGKEGGSAKEYRNEAREKEAMEKWETDEDSSEAVKDEPEKKEDESPYQTGFQSGDYTYYVQEDGGACITNYKGLGYALNLPKELNGHAVKRIGRGAFANRSMVSITLPDTLTAIGDEAFYRCRFLSDIQLPAGIKAIGGMAFFNCDSLVSINLPDSLTTLGEAVFKGTDSMKNFEVSANHPTLKAMDGVLYTKDESTLLQYPVGRGDREFAVPEGVRAIGADAFYGCACLSSVKLPAGIKAIGDRAFGGCRSLSDIQLPAGIKAIGDEAFSNCHSLRSINLPDSLTTLGEAVFGGTSSMKRFEVSANHPTLKVMEGVLYEKRSHTLLHYPAQRRDEEFVVPNGIQAIGYRAFEGCRSLSSVELPDSLTAIGDRAFEGCRSLSSVELPDTLTAIGDWAFSGCRSLSDIQLPAGIKAIGGWAFSGCRSLSRMTIPKGVNEIGYGAFKDCDALTLNVKQGSYAQGYAEEKGIPYVLG